MKYKIVIIMYLLVVPMKVKLIYNLINVFYFIFRSKVFTDLQIVMFSNCTDDISLDQIDSLITCIQHLNIHLTIM